MNFMVQKTTKMMTLILTDIKLTKGFKESSSSFDLFQK